MTPLTVDCCGVSSLPLPETSEAQQARLAALCRALGHPARVQILCFLVAQNRCLAGEIAEAMPQAPSTVSQHLKQLKEVGLIQGEIDGPRRSYCAAPAALEQLRDLLDVLTRPPSSAPSPDTSAPPTTQGYPNV